MGRVKSKAHNVKAFSLRKQYAMGDKIIPYAYIKMIVLIVFISLPRINSSILETSHINVINVNSIFKQVKQSKWYKHPSVECDRVGCV